MKQINCQAVSRKLRFSRKGQGLPITTIIIALIGLIVLVVLIGLVYQQTTKFSRGTKEISEATCEPKNEKKSLGANCEVIYARFTDIGVGDICCKHGR